MKSSIYCRVATEGHDTSLQAQLNEGAKIEGIIPLEKIPSDINSDSVERTHHWTNMGITTWV
jgi:hypothetical protein